MSAERAALSPAPAAPAGWLPSAFNRGHTYRDRIRPADLDPATSGSEAPGSEAAPLSVSAFYARRYPHSEAAVWRQRLAAGQICRNGQQLRADGPLAAGDRLAWHRPPWQEGAVPVLPGPLFDDGDLLVFNKPSGLPVLPAGGWLEHTLLGQLERQVVAGVLDASAGRPRPVHRLGRFTSGLLVCARRPATRAWLSALLREGSDGHESDRHEISGHETNRQEANRQEISGQEINSRQIRCQKIYRALLQPPVPGSPLLALQPGDSLSLTTPIGRCPHGRLGMVWAATPVVPSDPAALAGLRQHAPLPARSTLTVVQRGDRAWLVEVRIATGRPHQIRIHTAAAGAPLLGDPLYGPGGVVCERALPGDGGYHLHAHRLQLPLPGGEQLALEAPLPERLQARHEQTWDEQALHQQACHQQVRSEQVRGEQVCSPQSAHLQPSHQQSGAHRDFSRVAAGPGPADG